MALSHGEIDILFSASEDCIPLWEIKWEVAPEVTDAPDAELVLRGQAAIRRLLAQGLIELYRCQSGEDRQETRLAPEEWERVISDVNHWRSPMESWEERLAEDQEFFCFFITNGGKEYYVHSEEVIDYHKTQWYSAHSRKKNE